MMKHREFITLLGGAASIAWPRPSRGQEPDVPMGTRARRQKRHNQRLYLRQLNLF